MKNEIRVSSWEELQTALFDDTWDDRIRRFRSSYVYRGLSDASYELKTSLIRLEGDFEKLEKHMIRNFRKYAHREFESDDSAWNWLAQAQHHGLPTRLLDWTYSPYVALHFATVNLDKFECDGVIWAINYVKSTELIPDSLRLELQSEGSNVFTADMLRQVCSSLSELEAMEKNREPFLIFFEPPSLDERIVNQFALFSLMSNKSIVLDDWLSDHSSLYRKIVIPKELKWEVRDKLDQANITERVLFPGLDGLSSWLKRHYSPKRP